MDRRQLLFGASALGLVTNLNLNHPLIAQVGNAVMGSRRLSDRERAGLRGPVKTCSDLIGEDIESIHTDYSTDGRLLGHRLLVRVVSGGFKCGSVRPNWTDQFHYDEQGRKTRVRTISGGQALLIVMGTISQTQPSRGTDLARLWGGFTPMLESRMFEVAVSIGSLFGSAGFTVTTRYNENDQPIESLIRNANGELLTKINQNYKNGRLISETGRQMQERFPENEQERKKMARRRAFLDQLQGLGMECSYTYDADDRVIRRLMQMGNSKEDERKTYNEQGDEDWTLTIGFGDERSEFRYLYQYDSHDNWTERTTVNADHTGDPNTQRRTLAYY
jgi:hypothetical protein